MKTLVTALITSLAVPAMLYATPALFPAGITNDVAPNVEFGVLKARPDTYKGRAVQLAGRIMEVHQVDNGTLIVAKQLPIQEFPAYGPSETVHATGLIAVLYPGKVDPAGLRDGNKFIVVAEMQGAKPVSFDGAIRPQTYLLARCMHVWKTGRYYEISDFPHIADGYYPLEEQTYCTK